MPPAEPLRALTVGADAMLWGRRTSIWLGNMAWGTSLGRDLASLEGANVLLRTADPLFAGLALIELDGVAARIVIAPPDISGEHLPSVIERAGIDAVVGEDAALAVSGTRFVRMALPLTPLHDTTSSRRTEWVLFTSGTSGVPKMVAHSLAGLSGAIRPDAKAIAKDTVWGTFYDIRRYGGLQIFLRALTGRSALILSDAREETGDFLVRLGRHGVTHLTGTPSHWRRALMSPVNVKIAPRYLRLSGEIADQAILDSLKARFPGAALVHAYASTEAGVGFEVTDGLEGFPAALVGQAGPVEVRLVDDALHVRSPRTATEYIGEPQEKELLSDGFVDTGDLIEQRDGRCHFAGRRGGVINVGGLKIAPEEVEAVINRHPGVRASRVHGRRNPITGAVVVADVVLADPANDDATFRETLLGFCRERLPAFMVPAMLQFVPALELTAAGKIVRSMADAIRNVLVTGATRGVGLAIARKLAAEGYRVLALGRTQSEALTAAMDETPDGLVFVPFDLGEIEALSELAHDLKSDYGPFYGLVNNAALGTEGLLANLHNSQIEGLVRLNTISPLVLTKYVARAMMAAGEGRIVNVSSIIATTGYSGLSVYGATKASLLGFTRSLAREVGALGVTVNAVAPGFMDTDMTRSMSDGQRDKIANRSALKRLVDVADVANAVAYLLSDAARNITGTVMTVDAGNTA